MAARARHKATLGSAGIMDAFLVIGAVALDRPVRLDRPLRAGGRVQGRSLDGALAGRLGGGAANAGCALAAAGHRVLAATSLADDADGARARALAEAAGLDLRLSTVRPGPSRTTLVLIDPEGERTILGLDAPGGTWPAVATPMEHPGVRPRALFVRGPYAGAAAWAQATQGPVLLHWPAPGYDGEADIAVASDDDLASTDVFAEAAATLGPRLKWVVVTHGAGGAVAHGPEGPIAALAPRAQVRDATGAGDVFAAGLLDALQAGAGMAAALAHACAWGAAAVALEGSAPVDAPAGTFRMFSRT
jgi:ribokinase